MTAENPDLVSDRHHLDEEHSLLLYAILERQHRLCQEDHSPNALPAATQDYLREATGWARSDLTRALEVLKRGRFIITAKIHTTTAMKENNGAREVYEVDPRTCITEWQTAVYLVNIVMATKDTHGRIVEQSLKSNLEEYIRQNTLTSEQAAFLIEAAVHEGTVYKGKRTELTDFEYIERTSDDTIRPRLRLYLEIHYLRFIIERLDSAQIKERFKTYQSRHTRKKKKP